VRFKNKDIFIYYKRTALAYITAGVVVVNFEVVGMATGVDPTTLSYNTSAEKIYNATNCIAFFRIEIIFPTLKTLLPATMLAL
jgi:uncharacterized membrane protein YidH (DUF202 family)